MRKTAIVTGASRGIGRAIALRLAADGFGLVVNYAGNVAKAEEVVNEITRSGGSGLGVQADVANPEDVKQLFEKTLKAFGQIDVVVNNAGIMPLSPIAETFDKVIATNLRGTFLVLSHAAQHYTPSLGYEIASQSKKRCAALIPDSNPDCGRPSPPEALMRWIVAGTIRTFVFWLVAMALFACHRSPREPVTLRFTPRWTSRPDELSRMAALSEQFTRETGIAVKNIPTTESSLDALDLHHRVLPEGSAGTDVLAIDLIWLPIIESDLIDLQPYLAAEISLLEPELLPNYTVGGKVVAIPYSVNMGALEYRTDLLGEYGYHHPPRTWNELESMAARIQAGERAKGNKDFWGYVWQGAPTEALTCNALEWQVAEGGGQIIESDRTISVNNPAAIRAWQRAKHWIGWVSPPGVVAYRERDSMNVFDAGRAAFDRIWLGTTIARSGRSRQLYWRGSLPLMKTGYTSVPGVSAGTLGGSGLAVSRYTVHRQEAIELIRFLTRAQIQSGIPAGLSARPELNDPSSIFEGSDQHVKGVVTRPSAVIGPAYEEVSKAYIRAVHSVLAGQRGASEAAADLEKQLIQITGFSSGRPETLH